MVLCHWFGLYGVSLRLTVFCITNDSVDSPCEVGNLKREVVRFKNVKISAFAEGQVIEDESVDTSGGAFDENESVRRRSRSVPKRWQAKDSEEEWSEVVVANSFSR